MHRKGEFTKIKGSTCNIPIEASHQNYGRSSVMIDQISNLVKQSFPEIRRNDRSLNETIWTGKQLWEKPIYKVLSCF